jgi:hypothetical protein
MPFKLAPILSTAAALFKERADLVAENIALRHQLSCLIHRGSRPKLRPIEACPFGLPGRFLIRDNDKIYGIEFRNRVDGLGLEQIRIDFRSPWRNGFAKRWNASLRRDCLDPVIAIDERQLRRVIRSYGEYFHGARTHLGLEKDAP